MSNGIYRTPKPENEAILSYLPGSPEKDALKAEIGRMTSEPIEIPLIINGEEVRTGNVGTCRVPHDKATVLATYHQAGPREMEMAIEAALAAKKEWMALPWDQRISIFLRAAELIGGPWRQTLNAATMLGQSKSVHEADADSACELMDFFRYNAWFLRRILEEQPQTGQAMFNRMEYRPLEGFVFAVTPFNFTAIGGNLPTSPAMVGNTVVWKPASTAVFSNYHVMSLLQEAGLPKGVINFVPGAGREIGPVALSNPMLAGIHFTGSTATFNHLWREVGKNLESYRSYPRIVGETGGKDFLFAHASADIDDLVQAIIAGGFSYQGQKCSATSRVYIPRSIWPEVKEKLISEMAGVKAGDPADFTHYMGAVIDRTAFDSISGYIDQARQSEEADILVGGEYDDRVGYFIQPTLIQTTNPRFITMEEEIFGPVVTLFVYGDEELDQTLALCESTSAYALTGAIFAKDRYALQHIQTSLTYSAGNLYINDKTTGAFVGLQPFGGSRASGTNEKVGSKQNISRWMSPRTIKENFSCDRDYRLPLMEEA
ncbi:MAG: L-glutamate gamma-semialdehyde dehydrogenase [Desulfobacterales bacterium]|nr:L-glutamate gamma-semialdehyde dehydrogenase [Desulfobacterales bacterium]